MRPIHRGPLRTAILLALAAGLWFILGPVQFGGPASYVVTSGVSMLPLIHAGDLVVTRRAPSYQVGDVVAYHLTPKSIVLHRVVAISGDRYVVKGDNNDAPDSTQPAAGDVVGRMWLHLPSAGHYMALLRAPSTLAVLVFVSIAANVFSQRQRIRRRFKRGKVVSNQKTWIASGPPSPRDEMLALALVAVLITLALAVLAYIQPTQRAGDVDLKYRERGSFGYSAAASGGIYNGDQVTTGQPVYLHVVQNLDVHFDYRLATEAAHQTNGTIRLSMEVGQDSGWQRTVDLVPPAAFQGDQANVAATIDLAGLQGFLDSFSEQTGVHNSVYTLSLVPIVQVTGTLADQPLSDTFGPRLQFTLDANQLVLDHPADGGDPLRPVQDGAVSQPAMLANVFTILGLRIPVLTARLITLPAFVLAGLVAVGLAQPVLASRRADEVARIRARYGPMLLHGHAETQDMSERVIDLTSIEDLVKVAAKEGRMILHTNGTGPHQYLVTEGETVYRYRPAEPSPGTATTDAGTPSAGSTPNISRN